MVSTSASEIGFVAAETVDVPADAAEGPVAVAVEKLSSGASGLISVARRDPDGGAIRIALAQKVKVNTIAAAERLYVDLLPDNWKGPTPGLPQEVIDELVRRARQADVGREVNYHATALRPIEDDEACRGRSRRSIDGFKLRTGSVRSEVIPIRIALRT